MTQEQEQQESVSSPTRWLWAEIERRFGSLAARELHRAYNAQVSKAARRSQAVRDRARLPGLRLQLAAAQQESRRHTIEQSIARIEQRLLQDAQTEEKEVAGGDHR